MTTLVPDRPTRRRRRAASPAKSSFPGAPAQSVVAVILDGCASMAANTFADARRLALRLHNARQIEDARLALEVATALIEIATEAHRAAEYAAHASAQEGGAQWSQN